MGHLTTLTALGSQKHRPSFRLGICLHEHACKCNGLVGREAGESEKAEGLGLMGQKNECNWGVTQKWLSDAKGSLAAAGGPEGMPGSAASRTFREPVL